MTASQIRLLSIAPYRVLPATTGGHLGIVSMHDALGKRCEDHIISTADNGDAEKYSFKMHRFFPPKPVRYIPRYKLDALVRLSRELGITHIFCDHPYMAPTAIALSKKLGIPWFLRSHNIESTRFRDLGKPWWRLLFAFERMAMKKANGVFFITPEDRNWAIGHYGVLPALSHIAPYGTTFDCIPEKPANARQAIAEKLGIDAGVPWFYFIGVHSYQPNAEAVRLIVTEVLPRLQQQGLQCHILIGGKGLPEEIQALIQQTGQVMKYTGFIDDLDAFIHACDVMLNAVVSGGGIKTKAVEALGYNKIVVSTANGAAGILPEACGDNLLLAGDNDWDTFAAHCITAAKRAPAIPDRFYDHYYWGAIAQKVLGVMAGTRQW